MPTIAGTAKAYMKHISNPKVAYKLPSIAQDWARKRNWAKAQLVGMRSALYSLPTSHLITLSESNEVYNAIAHIEDLIDNWSKNNAISKKTYRKRKEN